MEANSLGTTLIVAALMCGTQACSDGPTEPAEAQVTEPSEAFPNEPDGLQLVAESTMEREMPVQCISGVGIGPVEGWDGVWSNFDGYATTTEDCGLKNNSIHDDPEAPVSPGFHRTRWPEGLAGGARNTRWNVPFTEPGASTEYAEYERIYFAMTFRLVDHGTGDWESHSTLTKMGFFGVGNTSSPNNDVFFTIDGGTQSAFSDVRLRAQNHIGGSYRQNVNAGDVLFVGQWHLWEAEMVLNDIGQRNGVLRMWIDGDLIMEHLDVEYRTESHPLGFKWWKWDPVWGGVGSTKSRDDFADISHVRISGARLGG